jgi:hypothetical protein
MGAGSRRQLAELLGRLVDSMALPDRNPPMFFEPAPGGGRKKRRARLA